MSVFLRKSTGPKKQTHTQQQPHNRLKRTFYLNLNLSPKKYPLNIPKIPQTKCGECPVDFGIFCGVIKIKPHLEIKLTILGDTYNIAGA